MSIQTAIVDYGICNMFSVKHACEAVGMDAQITSDKSTILSADLVILPGVGAFGDAMNSLERLGLINVLQEIATSSKPLIGICLGMQLLMDESEEFGAYKGLGIIPGKVIRLKPESQFKVPHVGWNQIRSLNQTWRNTPLEDTKDGEFVYFVHSYRVLPNNNNYILASSNYGGQEFCAAIKFQNIFAFQFHPERSGKAGLAIYKNLAILANREKLKTHPQTSSVSA